MVLNDTDRPDRTQFYPSDRGRLSRPGRLQCFLKLTAAKILAFNWIAGSGQVTVLQSKSIELPY